MGKGIATSMIIRPARRGRRSPRPDGGPAPLGIHSGAPISASTPHRRLGKDISGDLILSPVRVNASVRRTWVPGAPTAAWFQITWLDQMSQPAIPVATMPTPEEVVSRAVDG